jgi:hypothetical protein
MKLLAIAIVAAFAGGILLGLPHFAPGGAAPYPFPEIAAASACWFWLPDWLWLCGIACGARRLSLCSLGPC